MRIHALFVSLALLASMLVTSCGVRQSVEERLVAASFAIEQHEYDAASLELNNVLQEQPANADARILFARVSLAAGRPALAERHIRAALRLNSSIAGARTLLARALLDQGHFAQLLVEFEGPQNGPDAAALNALIGTAMLHLGMIDRARAQFRQAIADNPAASAGRIGMAKAALAAGDTRAAQAQLQDVLRTHPFEIRAHHTLGVIFFEQERFAEAERAFTEAVALPAGLDNADAWLLAQVALIETQWRVGKRVRALLSTRELLETFPSHPLPKYARALLAYYDQDYKLTSEYLRHVLHAVPDHLPSRQLSAAADFAQGRLGSAQINLNGEDLEGVADESMARLLADIYLRMGNGDDAVATLRPFVTQNSDAQTLDLFATANLYAGNIEAARQLMARALLQEPDRLDRELRYVAILLNAGKIAEADQMMAGWPTIKSTEAARTQLRLLRYLRSGDLARAEAYAKRQRRDNPSDLHALLTLAEVAEKSGHRDLAIGWLDIARQRNPAAIEPRFLLANYARRNGDAQQVREIAEEMLAIQPFNAAALSFLGDAYLKAGDNAGAIATLREATRVAPTTIRNTIDLARAQLATGDFWQGRQTIRDALLSSNVPLEQFAGIIVEEFQRGNDEQARALATELQDFDAGNPIGYSIEGDLYMLAGDFDKASAAYQTAQRLGGGRAVAVKAAASATATSFQDPVKPLSEWLKIAPNDRQIRRVIDALN